MSKATATRISALSRPTVEEGPSLPRILALLIDRLADLGDGVATAGTVDAAASQWDDDYVYLEIQLPPRADLEADISIHDGKVFVRIHKSLPGDDGPAGVQLAATADRNADRRGSARGGRTNFRMDGANPDPRPQPGSAVRLARAVPPQALAVG